MALGEALGCSLCGGVVVALVGPLGAGKTQLAKGIAVGNGIDDVRDVTSPTFTLVNEYEGRLKLYHLDAYRLSGSRELDALGFEEFARSDSAVVVEWADRVESTMPPDTLWVDLAYTDLSSRHIEARATGLTAKACLDAWQTAAR